MTLMLGIPVGLYCYFSTDLLKDIDAILQCILFLSTAFKHMFIRKYRKNLKVLVQQMTDDWNKASQLSKESQNFMVSNAKRGRIINLYCIIIGYTLILSKYSN